MALAHQFQVIANDNVGASPRKPKVRFSTIFDLHNGAPVGLNTETDISFEERAFFGFAKGDDTACPANWLGDLIERAGRLTTMQGKTERPISIIAPAAALSHPDAPMAAEAGASRANLCTQEFRLEFSDAALAEEEDLGTDRLDAFFRRGFRVGIDARTSWRTPLGPFARMIVESVRLDATRLCNHEVSEERLEAASYADILMFAENASWRDGEALAEFGVHYAVAPRSDS